MGFWKHLLPIKSRLPDRVSTAHALRLREVADRVRARTGCIAWFDTNQNDICFGTEPNGMERIAYSTPAFRTRIDENGRRVSVFNSPDWLNHATGSRVNEDDIVYSIMLGRVPQEQKDEWKNRREKEVNDEDAKARKVKIAEASEEGLKQTESEYQRYTMGKHYKGFAHLGS